MSYWEENYIVSPHAVKGWTRKGSSGPGDEEVLKDLKNYWEQT